MEEIPAQNQPEETAGEVLPETVHGLSRRDFVKVAAILTGSTLLLLGRCKPPYEEAPLEIPPEFKRFVLVEQSPTVSTEKIIVALGSQCPDMNCALWWVNNQEFQFFESVDQIVDLYVRESRAELIWLD
jgi:hypothetical protein